MQLNKRQLDNMIRYLTKQCQYIDNLIGKMNQLVEGDITKLEAATGILFYKGCIIGYCTARGLQYHFKDDGHRLIDFLVTGAGGALLFRHAFKKY